MREGFFLSRITANGLLTGGGGDDNSRTYATIYMEGSQQLNNNRSAFFHAPPLLLALVDPVLLAWIPSATIQDFIFELVMMFVDLFTAIRLFQLARNVLSSESLLSSKFISNGSANGTKKGDEDDAGDDTDEQDVVMQWEIGLEQKMDPSIQPKRAWVFGISFNTNDDEDMSSTITKEDKNPPSSDVVTTCPPPPKREAILELADIPQVCAIFYYCNPISILTNCCTACSFHGLWHLLVVSALQELTNTTATTTTKSMTTTNTSNGNGNGNGNASEASKPTQQQLSKSNVPMAMLYLAIVSHIEINSIIYLLPSILFTRRGFGYTRLVRSIVGCIGFFLLWSTLLQYLSLLLVGRSNFFAMLLQSYAKEYNFHDLEPNLGMQWYFFMNMFHRFRTYFAIMHFGVPYLFAAPLLLRFHRYPTALTAMLNIILSLCKTTPTLNDMVLAFSLLLMTPRTLARTTNKSLVSLVALPVPITLYVTDYWLWLETGSGNANYMFFQCLAYNVFFSVILIDVFAAQMLRQKALHLTEKGPKKVMAVVG